MKARLVECTDYDVIYGFLTVENVSPQEVQKEIYDIKKKFFEEGFGDWTIEDVLEKLPEEWEWNFERCDNVVEI